jgi:hypothetical protein
MKGLPLILVTMAFVGIFANSVISVQLSEVRANWNARRCEALVIAMAHMVPDGSDPSVDPTEFSVKNFAFCLEQMIEDSMKVAMAPINNAFNLQISLASPITNSTNYLRSNATSLVNPMASYFQGMWDRMKVLTNSISLAFYKLNSAFQRIQAAVISSIFAGISVIRGILNVINLVIWVIRLIIIIMMIIVAIILVIAIFIPSYFAYAAYLTLAIAIATASVASAVAAVDTEGFVGSGFMGARLKR